MRPSASGALAALEAIPEPGTPLLRSNGGGRIGTDVGSADTTYSSSTRSYPTLDEDQSVPCYLGIDHGTKRIGLAVSDAGATIASPLTTITASGAIVDDVRAVLKEAEAYDVDAFVLGLPLNMDDTEGKQAKLTRRFGDELARASDRPVHYFDERLSSFTAEELMQPAELTRKKKKARLDAIAAQVILQSFLDAQAEAGSPPAPADENDGE